MTDKEKYEALVAEIEHQKKETSIGLNEWENGEEHGRMDVINALQKKIKFMQGEPVSDELEKVVEEIVDPTVLNAYGVKEIANRLRRTIIESVSEEQVKKSLISKHEDKTCKENGNSLTQEPVSEDLEKVANQSGYAAYPVDMAEEFGGVIRDNNRYQRSSYIKGFIAGANWQKEQLMAKAIKVTIAIPYQNGDGGYTQLVDSKEALPFGENLKVLIIKEDKI